MTGGSRSGSAPRVVFATGNPGKLAEGRRLLAGTGLELVGLADLGLAGEVVEDAPDYAGNARRKAAHWAVRSGLAALADDSGLEVEALGGGLGVRSARFGGPELDDAGRNALLLERLAGIPPALRGATFVCVLVLAGPGGETLGSVRGECRGRIAAAPRGGRGFGYDPLFEIPGRGLTFAELEPEVKDRESHRGRAFAALRALLAERPELLHSAYN